MTRICGLRRWREWRWVSVAGRLGTRRTAKAGKTVTTRVGSRVSSVLVARCLCSALLAALRRRRGRLPIARKIWSELRGAFWQSRTNSIKSMPCRRRWWRGLVSNQRRRKPTDLQSVPFSHSGTSPRVVPQQPSLDPKKVRRHNRQAPAFCSRDRVRLLAF